MSYFLHVEYRAQYLHPYFNANTNSVQMVTAISAELNDNSPAGKGRNCRWNIHRMDPIKNSYRILPVGALADSKVLVARAIGQTVAFCPPDDPSLVNGGDLFEMIFSGNGAAYFFKSINTQGYLTVDPATGDTLITTTNTDARLRFFTTAARGTGNVITNYPDIVYNIKLGLSSNFLASRQTNNGSVGDLIVVSNPANPTNSATLQFSFEFVRNSSGRYLYYLFAPSTVRDRGPLYLSIRDDNTVVLVPKTQLAGSDMFVFARMVDDMGRFAILSERFASDGAPRFLRARAGLPVAALPLSQIGAEDGFHFVPCTKVSSSVASAPYAVSHFASRLLEEEMTRGKENATNEEKKRDVDATIVVIDNMFADSDFSFPASDAAASDVVGKLSESTNAPSSSSGWMYRLIALLLVGGVCLAALTVYSQFAGH